MRYLRQYGWSVLWGLLMFGLMIVPSNDLEGAPSFPGFDKLAHCGTFFVLTTLLYRENLLKHQQHTHPLNAVWKIVASTLIFAAITELAQMYLSPSRTADVWDFFADTVGIGMGSFAFLLLYRK